MKLLSQIFDQENKFAHFDAVVEFTANENGVPDADRLQTGMRGAYGKPQGLVARVRIGQPLMSMRVKEQHAAHAFEALRRAKFKFPGRQKIFTSKKWGFTKFDREQFQEGLLNGTIVTDGVGCQYKPNHGPIAAWKKRMAA